MMMARATLEMLASALGVLWVLDRWLGAKRVEDLYEALVDRFTVTLWVLGTHTRGLPQDLLFERGVTVGEVLLDTGRVLRTRV